MRQMLKEADMHAAMMADKLAEMYSMKYQNSRQNLVDNQNQVNKDNSNSHNDGDHDQDDD